MGNLWHSSLDCHASGPGLNPSLWDVCADGWGVGAMQGHWHTHLITPDMVLIKKRILHMS